MLLNILMIVYDDDEDDDNRGGGRKFLGGSDGSCAWYDEDKTMIIRAKRKVKNILINNTLYNSIVI